MKDWRKFYTFENIEKGYDLYFHGYVNHLKYNDEHIIGFVKKYKVVFDLENHKISNPRCTCHQKRCSHQTAILIAYETKQQSYLENYYSSDQLVSKLTPSQKDEILKYVFDQYPEYRMGANQLLGKTISKIDEELFELHQIIFQYNKDGIVFPLQLYIHSFIEKNKNRDDYLLFELLIQRIKLMEQTSETTMLLSQVLNDLNVYMGQYPEYQSKIFDLLKLNIDNEMFVDFIFHSFSYEPYLTYKLELINTMIEKVKAYEAWGQDYYLERYLVLKLKTLYYMKNDVEISDILNSYYKFPKIREFFILCAIENEDLQTAISIIEESQIIDKNNPYLLIQYQNYLIDIYENTNSKKYFESLYKQLFEYDLGALDIYFKFKKICPPNKWPYYLNKLLESDIEEERLLDILLEEQRYSLLFQIVVASQNLYYLEKKKHLLIKRCPNEFEKVYQYLKG